MTDHDALLTAILANRADDTPRLVFADWCEENGQPERGEFIRAQCELARWGGCDWKTKHIRAGYVDCDQWNDLLGEGRVMTWCPTCARRNELRRRERELLGDCSESHPSRPNWGLWSDPIWDTGILIGRPWMERMDFSRGFVSSLACSWSDWRTHADAILARQPIERVKLTTRPGEFEETTVGSRDGSRYYKVAGKIVRMAEQDHVSYESLLKARWTGIEFELPPEQVLFRGAPIITVSQLESALASADRG